MNNWTLFKLESNYRSGSNICEIANILIRHNTNRIPKLTVSATGENGLVTVTEHATEEAELDWMAGEIRKYNHEDCAVLLRYRTGGFMERFELGLSSRGIPVARTVQPLLPQDWRRAKLLLALLNDPENDGVAQWWIESRESAAVSKSVKLKASASRQSINAYCLKLPKSTSMFEAGVTCARAGISQESRDRIGKAISGIGADASIADLLLALSAAEKESETVGSGVTVTTLHGAKGTEFPVVFMPAAEQEIMPGTKTGPELEEERRLFYVGITRAIHTLYLSFSSTRMPLFAATRPKPATPSQFLREAGLI